MLNTLFRNLCFFTDYYLDFIVSAWDHISFWQYLSLSALVVIMGYFSMSGGAIRGS